MAGGDQVYAKKFGAGFAAARIFVVQQDLRVGSMDCLYGLM